MRILILIVALFLFTSVADAQCKGGSCGTSQRLSSRVTVTRTMTAPATVTMRSTYSSTTTASSSQRQGRQGLFARIKARLHRN